MVYKANAANTTVAVRMHCFGAQTNLAAPDCSLRGQQVPKEQSVAGLVRCILWKIAGIGYSLLQDGVTALELVLLWLGVLRVLVTHRPNLLHVAWCSLQIVQASAGVHLNTFRRTCVTVVWFAIRVWCHSVALGVWITIFGTQI